MAAELGHRPADVRAWLREDPPLSELREAFPQEWAAVQRELGESLARGDLDDLRRYVERVSAAPRVKGGIARLERGQAALLSAQVKRQIAAGLLKQLLTSAATGATGGRVRFNLLNGFVAQRLLFRRDLERKPVSLRWFRVLWPLVWQRRFLMPLVQPKGIYCFYSSALVRDLAALIGDRACLEIAAGDGTLSRFLADAGVDVVATDDHSWAKAVTSPDGVVRQDAREALRKRRPQAVVCSWPPAGNPFEREVFRTASVDLYIVIGSGDEHGSGDWESYRAQRGFTLSEEPELSRLVLPPELGAKVYVFRRSAGAAQR